MHLKFNIDLNECTFCRNGTETQDTFSFLVKVEAQPTANLDGKVICCGDFNAHSTLWDSYNDGNGELIEEVMETKNLVCLNDGNGKKNEWGS